MFLVYILEFFKLPVLTTEDLYDVHPCDVFLNERVEVCHGIADIIECNLDLFLEDVRADQQKRKRRQTQQRKPPVLIEHECQDKNDLKKIAGHGCNTFAKNVCERFNIGNCSRHQSADRGLVKKLQPETYDMGIKFRAEIANDLLTQPSGQVSMNVLGDRLNY